MENKWEKWEVKNQRNMPYSTTNGMERRVVKKVKKKKAVAGEGMGRRIHKLIEVGHCDAEQQEIIVNSLILFPRLQLAVRVYKSTAAASRIAMATTPPMTPATM